jgi:hypothetical protein
MISWLLYTLGRVIHRLSTFEATTPPPRSSSRLPEQISIAILGEIIAQESIDISTRIVVLQPKAIEELRPNWRKKTRVIYQSVEDKQAPTGARGSSTKTRTTKAEARTNGRGGK